MKQAVFAIAVLLFSCGGNAFEQGAELGPTLPPVVDDGAQPPADRPDAEPGADAGAVDRDAAARNPLADAWPSDVVVDDAPELPHCPNCYPTGAGNNACCKPGASNLSQNCSAKVGLTFCAECPGNMPFGMFTSCAP
jgi:hypothetical protein